MKVSDDRDTDGLCECMCFIYSICFVQICFVYVKYWRQVRDSTEQKVF